MGAPAACERAADRADSAAMHAARARARSGVLQRIGRVAARECVVRSFGRRLRRLSISTDRGAPDDVRRAGIVCRGGAHGLAACAETVDVRGSSPPLNRDCREIYALYVRVTWCFFMHIIRLRYKVGHSVEKTARQTRVLVPTMAFASEIRRLAHTAIYTSVFCMRFLTDGAHLRKVISKSLARGGRKPHG